MARVGMREIVRRSSPWGRLFAAGALALFVALAVRAIDPDRWSDWSFGEAGTMLTMRHWQEAGWLANYLLYIPQGYAGPIRHLDDPDLRQHAHGISPGSSPRVGPRLWYTHYPPGYLIPFALLAKAGLGSMAPWRLLSLAMSFTALALMYLVFARISSPAVAFIAALFYALSPAFLGYADAIANQPLDDLLRFGFMLAVVLSTRALEPRARRAALVVAWAIEFTLSLCSYDSVFFVFLWFVGWDLIEGRRFTWRKYLAFGAGPVAAFGLLLAQNAWYLGWGDAARDVVDAFLRKAPTAVSAWNVGHGWFGSTYNSLALVFEALHPHPLVLLAAASAYGFWHRSSRRTGTAGLPTAGTIALLLLCGASFEMVLPHAAWMPYQARQMVPFAALAAGGLTVAVARDAALLGQRLRTATPASSWSKAALVAAAACGTIVIWGFWGWNVGESLLRSPSFAIPPDDLSVLIAKDLSTHPTIYDAIFFDQDGFAVYGKFDVKPGYRQIPHVLEYYLGSKPILAFASADLLVTDLVRLAQRAPREFSPVLVSRDLETLRAVVSALDDCGQIVRMPEAPQQVRDVFVLDLTPVMNW